MLKKQQQIGLTLIELMVVLVVMAIILGIGVPGFQSFIHNQRSMTWSDNWISSVYRARSEAIRRGNSVTLCPASDSATTSCGDATDWARGWIVFDDPDDNETINNTSERLDIHLNNNMNITVSTTLTRIRFNASGFLASTAGQLAIQSDPCYGNHRRTLQVFTSGRIQVERVACT